jgi:hypothetical protein
MINDITTIVVQTSLKEDLKFITNLNKRLVSKNHGEFTTLWPHFGGDKNAEVSCWGVAINYMENDFIDFVLNQKLRFPDNFVMTVQCPNEKAVCYTRKDLRSVKEF